MSAALVRKSLQLFEDDISKRDVRGKGKKSSGSKIGINKAGIQKQHRATKTKKSQIQKHEKRKTFPIEKPDSSKDHTEKNVSLLQQLSEAAKTEEMYTTAVFGYKNEDTKPKEESTLFTDADFDKFEKEYNFK